MSVILTAGTMEAMRANRILQHMQTYLVELDADRFRGLGKAHREAFIQHGLAYCDRAGLEFLEHIEYVHFIMYFLGSHFGLDPRYAVIGSHLTAPDVVANQRIENAYRCFSVYARRFIGPGMSTVQTAMAQFDAALARHPSDYPPARDLLDAFQDGFTMSDQERARFPEAAMADQAVKAAQALDIDTDAGRSLCLALGLWLGTGFYQDPLFPWVRDVTQDAGGGTQQRIETLKAYATKRMARMLPAGETPCA